MKLFSILFLFLCVGCSQSADQVPISLSLDSAVSKTDIKQFIFVVSAATAGTGDALIFPANCVDATGCRIKDCGFPATQSGSFDLKLPLSGSVSFPDNGSVNVVACAFDASQAAIAGGTKAVVNKGSTADSITLTKDVTSCNGIPALCP